MPTENQTFFKTTGHTLERTAKLMFADPANAELVGPGDRFPTEASLLATLRRLNPQYERRSGEQLVCGEDGVNRMQRWSGHLVPANQPLIVPPAFAQPTGYTLTCAIAPALVVEEPAVDDSVTRRRVTTPPPFQPEGQGARLPVFPTAGNLAGGRTNQTYDTVNALPLFGIMPNQPHVAARGANPIGVGSHTIGDRLESIVRLAPFIPLPVGPVTVIPIGLGMTTPNSQNRVAQAREGGNGTNQEGPDRFRDPNLSPVTERGILRGTRDTVTDATYLPGVGIEHNASGRVLDIVDGGVGARWNNNPFYNVMGEGESGPAVTSNQRAVRSNGEHQNWYMQGTPSGPQAIPLNNYAIGTLVDNQFTIPQMEAATAALQAEQSQANIQRMVSLYNLREQTTGISNEPLTIDVRQVLPQAELERMGREAPRNAALYNRQRLLDLAASQNMTIDANAVAEVRSITRAQLRENHINYYAEMAAADPRISQGQPFPFIYESIVGEGADYDRKNPEQVRAVATRFVDALPYIQTFPEQGVPMEAIRDLYHSPRAQFNPVETLTYVPQTPARDASAVAPAMEAIAANPDNVRAILEAAGTDSAIASAIGYRDNFTIQLPGWHGRDRHNFGERLGLGGRGDEQRDVAARGYRPDLMENVFTTGKTNGVLRNLPAIQEDLARSASDDSILALRQRDLREMVRDGREGTAVGVGAHANSLLHALAEQPNNAVLMRIEENIRRTATTQEAAAQQIEALRQGVDWAKDHVTTRHTRGASHTDLAYNAQARGALALGQTVDGAATGAGAVIGGARGASAAGASDVITGATGTAATGTAATGAAATGAVIDGAVIGGARGASAAGASDVITGATGTAATGAAATGAAATGAAATGAAATGTAATGAVIGGARGASAAGASDVITGATGTAATGAPATGFERFRATVTASGNRNVNVTNAYLNYDRTNATALSALNESQPSLMTAAVMQTLRSNEALQQPVVNNLRTLDNGRGAGFLGLGSSPQDRLASLVQNLVRAENAGNQGRVMALSMELDAFVTNPANARAVSDLYAATLMTNAGGVDGRAALTAAISNAVTAAAGTTVGENNVAGLPGYNLTGDAFVTTVTNAMATFDPSRAAQNAAVGIGVVAAARTHDGRIIPAIVLPRGGARRQEPDTDLPGGQPPGEPPIKGCCDVPVDVPAPPGLPVQPVPPIVPPIKEIIPTLPPVPVDVVTIPGLPGGPIPVPDPTKLLPVDSLITGTTVAPLGTGAIPGAGVPVVGG